MIGHHRRLAQMDDHCVGGPLGFWLLTPISIRLSIDALCQLNVVCSSQWKVITVCVQSLSAARLARCDAMSSATVLHGAKYRAEYRHARTNTVQSPGRVEFTGRHRNTPIPNSKP